MRQPDDFLLKNDGLYTEERFCFMTFDSGHGDRLVTVLAWNRIEQLAVWAVGGTAEGVDTFLTRLPRKCAGAN